MLDVILDALRQTGTTYLEALKAFLPRVLATLSILLVGWLVALVLGSLTRRVLHLLRFNTLSERIGAADVLKKVDLPTADKLAGSLVFWLVFIGVLLSGIDALGFKGVEGLMSEFVHLIPRLVVAVVLLVVGLLAANFAWRATLLAAVNANLPSARLVAGAVRFLIMVMTVAMALEQVALAKTVVLTAFAIAFGAVMLAVAIAFGIGGGRVAQRLLEQHFPERESSERDASTHL